MGICISSSKKDTPELTLSYTQENINVRVDGDEVDDIADPDITPAEQWDLLTKYPLGQK